MSKKTFLKISFLFVLFSTVLACNVATLRNVDHAQYTTNAKMEQIEKAIIRAGGSLKWQMKPIEKGHLVGTLFLRKHTALIDVHYDTKEFSITYKDSSNLKYDGKKIHKRYNQWIDNLTRRIQMEVATL